MKTTDDVIVDGIIVVNHGSLLNPGFKKSDGVEWGTWYSSLTGWERLRFFAELALIALLIMVNASLVYYGLFVR